MNAASYALGVVTAGGVGFAALAWKSVSPTSAFWGALHHRGSSASGRYALTFDDGPTRDSTTAILDMLAELRVPAAFFVVGANARRCPDLLVRMHAERHLIGNHSLDHDHVAMFRGARYWIRQLSETDKIIEQATGVRPARDRPPTGR